MILSTSQFLHLLICHPQYVGFGSLSLWSHGYMMDAIALGIILLQQHPKWERRRVSRKETFHYQGCKSFPFASRWLGARESRNIFV